MFQETEFQKTEIEVNSKYIPTFKSNDIVYLTRDCESYGVLAEFYNRFFKKNRGCIVVECGLSHFFVDEENRFIRHVEDCEWCSVEAEIYQSEYDFDDEYNFLEGVVRGRDLRESTDKDVIREYSY